ncbi:MAG: FG-GAP repeat domain-containing protein [Pseudomonadota bacterium]
MRRITTPVAAVVLALLGTAAQAQYSAQFIETSKAWGSLVADFNGDGHDDFMISGHDTDDRLWYWSPAGYVPSAQALEWVDRHACTPADFNRDGRLDFYCTIGADHGDGIGLNELWLQDADGVFHKSTDHGAADPYGRGRIPIAFDMNHDGYMDLYVTNEATQRPDGEINHNHVFINQGGAGFVELQTAATGPRGFQCVAKGDLNQDGWDDLLVCNGKNPPHIYLNNRAGDFTEVVSAAAGASWRDARLADMNGDGRDDLVVLTGPNDLQIWLNSGASPFFQNAPAYASHMIYTSKSLAVGDFNRDGVPDVYVVLQKADCLTTTRHDVAPDLVFQGRPNGTWAKLRQPQDYDGCGYRAATIEGSRVLLMNGGVSYPGPNYVVKWGD